MARKLGLVAAAILGATLLVQVSTGSGQATLCFGSPATITGSGTIQGTMGDDVMVGSDGPDTMHGLAGNDKICAGGGDDDLGGGPGDDQIDAGAGNDKIDGGPGNDTILGGDGDDTIRCGGEHDTADGGAGVNTAETSGFEACEVVTNASPPAVADPPKPHPLAATLTPAAAVPRPKGVQRGASGRLTGTVTATATGATLRWRLTFKGLTGAALSAHVHQGSPGRTGSLIARLCGPCKSGSSGTAQVFGQPDRAALNQGTTYVEIHTKRNPKGEIRGQIKRLD